jgi:hypothetical protein
MITDRQAQSAKNHNGGLHLQQVAYVCQVSGMGGEVEVCEAVTESFSASSPNHEIMVLVTIEEVQKRLTQLL